MIDPQYTKVEHLGDPYLGAWYIPDIVDEATADAAIEEVRSSGCVEPVWELTDNLVNQQFERLLIDLLREHPFSEVADIGRVVSETVVNQVAPLFPNASQFTPEEAAVQIYPAGSTLPLGWHKDHILDKFLVISVALAGTGVISFTEKLKTQNIKEEDILANIVMAPRSALVFRADRLFEREDNTDIRKRHAVTYIDPESERFSILYRIGSNSGAYGNHFVNANAPLLNAA